MTLRNLASLAVIAGMSSAMASSITGYTNHVSANVGNSTQAATNSSVDFLSNSFPAFISGLDDMSTQGSEYTGAQSEAGVNIVSNNEKATKEVNTTPSGTMSNSGSNVSNYALDLSNSTYQAVSNAINWLGETFMTQSATDFSSQVSDTLSNSASQLSAISALDKAAQSSIEALNSSYVSLAESVQASEVNSTRASETTYAASVKVVEEAQVFISNVGQALVATSNYSLNLSQGSSLEASASVSVSAEALSEQAKLIVASQSNLRTSGASSDVSVSQITDGATRLVKAVVNKQKYSKDADLTRAVQLAKNALLKNDKKSFIAHTKTVEAHYVAAGNDVDTAKKAAALHIAAAL